MPQPLIEVLLAAYIGTGCDSLSRIGTKAASLNCIPEMYLSAFGKTGLSESQVSSCEAFLVKVHKASSECTTFDSLRLCEYKRTGSVIDLPPTSYSIRKGHIPRWWYIVSEMSSLLENNYEPKNPCNFQWEKQGGHLIPSKNLHSTVE